MVVSACFYEGGTNFACYIDSVEYHKHILWIFHGISYGFPFLDLSFSDGGKWQPPLKVYHMQRNWLQSPNLNLALFG